MTLFIYNFNFNLLAEHVKTKLELDQEQILYFENFDLTTIVTPVKVDVLEKLLIQSNYCPHKTKFLVKGFTSGFSSGYKGDTKVQRMVPNLKFRIGNELVLWNKVMKEVKEGRYAGPFKEPP